MIHKIAILTLGLTCIFGGTRTINTTEYVNFGIFMITLGVLILTVLPNFRKGRIIRLEVLQVGEDKFFPKVKHRFRTEKFIKKHLSGFTLVDKLSDAHCHSKKEDARQICLQYFEAEKAGKRKEGKGVRHVIYG